NTPFAYLTMGDMQKQLKLKNTQINNLKLTGLNLSRTLLVRARHLDGHSRFVLAVSKGDIPRIHSITSNHFENGGSIFSLMEKLGRAVNHAFQDQSYTLADHQRLYLFLKLGGTAAAELAHRTMGLPSINAAKRHIASVPLIASPKGPTMDEMTHNLKVSYPSPHRISSWRDASADPCLLNSYSIWLRRNPGNSIQLFSAT
ncbi:hypothetical protein B0H10DRAFT_1812907, partial [Mycena sp. CBHHK59/15]